MSVPLRMTGQLQWTVVTTLLGMSSGLTDQVLRLIQLTGIREATKTAAGATVAARRDVCGWAERKGQISGRR